MSGNNTKPIGNVGGNKIAENTVPWTNDFLVPQNCAVIRSSILKFKRFDIKPILW